MGRKSFVVFGQLGVALGVTLIAPLDVIASSASAEPTCADVPVCVPGIALNAVRGASCAPSGKSHQYVFGIDVTYPNTGRTYICLLNSGSRSRTWADAPPLYGVQRVGDLCTGGWSAQSLDGYPMLCTGNGRWSIYLSDVG